METRKPYTDVSKTDVLGPIKVERAARCRTSDGTSINVSFTIDYNGTKIIDVLMGDVASKTIAGQRAWEKYSHAEFKENVQGKTFLASEIGKKIVSDKELAQKIGKERLLRMIEDLEDSEALEDSEEE